MILVLKMKKMFGKLLKRALLQVLSIFRVKNNSYSEEDDSFCVMAEVDCQDQGKSAGGLQLFLFFLASKTIPIMIDYIL